MGPPQLPGPAPGPDPASAGASAPRRTLSSAARWKLHPPWVSSAAPSAFPLWSPLLPRRVPGPLTCWSPPPARERPRPGPLGSPVSRPHCRALQLLLCPALSGLTPQAGLTLRGPGPPVLSVVSPCPGLPRWPAGLPRLHTPPAPSRSLLPALPGDPANAVGGGRSQRLLEAGLVRLRQGRAIRTPVLGRAPRPSRAGISIPGPQSLLLPSTCSDSGVADPGGGFHRPPWHRPPLPLMEGRLFPGPSPLPTLLSLPPPPAVILASGAPRCLPGRTPHRDPRLAGTSDPQTCTPHTVKSRLPHTCPLGVTWMCDRPQSARAPHSPAHAWERLPRLQDQEHEQVPRVHKPARP